MTSDTRTEHTPTEGKASHEGRKTVKRHERRSAAEGKQEPSAETGEQAGAQEGVEPTEPTPAESVDVRAEIGALLLALERYGINTGHMLGQIEPQIKVNALIGALVTAGLVTDEAVQARFEHEKAAVLRGFLVQVEAQADQQRREAERAAKQRVSQLEAVKRPALYVPHGAHNNKQSRH